MKTTKKIKTEQSSTWKSIEELDEEIHLLKSTMLAFRKKSPQISLEYKKIHTDKELQDTIDLINKNLKRVRKERKSRKKSSTNTIPENQSTKKSKSTSPIHPPSSPFSPPIISTSQPLKNEFLPKKTSSNTIPENQSTKKSKSTSPIHPPSTPLSPFISSQEQKKEKIFKKIIQSIESGNYKQISELLDEKKNLEIMNQTDLQGNTCLMKVFDQALVNSHQKFAQLLIEKGKCNINAQSLSGNTALMKAVFRSDPETVEFLLKSGADVSLENNRRETAIDIACNRSFDEICTILLKFGAKLNFEQKFSEKIKKKELNFSLYLLKKTNTSVLKNTKSTLLMLEKIELLLFGKPSIFGKITTHRISLASYAILYSCTWNDLYFINEIVATELNRRKKWENGNKFLPLIKEIIQQKSLLMLRKKTNNVFSFEILPLDLFKFIWKLLWPSYPKKWIEWWKS